MKELKARREELKIKQQDLADQLGISRTQLSRYENGLREADESIIEKWKGILFGLKFSDLEVGDYVYVHDNLVEFEVYGKNSYVSEIGSGYKCINSIENNQLEVNNCGYLVTPEMLDLSRSMKREDYLKVNGNPFKDCISENFYELCDVLNNAYKDGIIDYYVKHDNGIDIPRLHLDFGTVEKWDTYNIGRCIEFIQSLYTEEFIIEKMADELRVKPGAQLILSNGMKCIYFDDGDRKLRHDDDFYPCNFLVLKGATVKQSK